MSEGLDVEVVIIGAGIGGLIAAHKLEAEGVRVAVLEQDRQVGGRMATLDVGPGRGDSGAQFFTVHLPEFQDWVDRLIEDGIVFPWSQGFSDGSLLLLPTLNSYPHYAVQNGMRALPERFAQSLKQVRTDCAVLSATYDAPSWVIQASDNTIYTGKALVMTPPVPVALKLLREGGTSLTELDFDALSAITYAPCLTGVFWVDQLVQLPDPGAIQRHNTNIIWIGNNRQKGISPDATIITLQAGAQYSVQLWNATDERILNVMHTQLQSFLPAGASVRESHLQRWQYARPITTHRARYLTAAGDIPLVFAGDAFNGPRVEGAVLSGLAAAKAVLGLL